MIARKTWYYPTLCSKRLPGTSPRVNIREVSYRSDQTKTLQVVAVSGDVRGSRLPTHAESGKPKVPNNKRLT